MNETGLLRIFHAWQIEAIGYLWEVQKPVKSSEMHLYLKMKDVRSNRSLHGTVSRASVINFLNSLVDDGMATYTESTGKGGYHKLYSLVEEVKTKERFKRYVSEKIVDALQTFRINE